MDTLFSQIYEERRLLFTEFLIQAFDHVDVPNSEGAERLFQSMAYSLLQEGGKRFRPVLSLLLAESFGGGPARVLPWATAVEMIHTYSLIHDDLPCMDDDDLRRGHPTNHKVFGESTALLAGDGLLTEAFRQIVLHYEAEPQKVVQLIRVLSEAAGPEGMVSGQAIDLMSQESGLSLQDLKHMHSLKTGALIRATCEGTAVVLGLTADAQKGCRNFGSLLGLAFQLKDDLLDSEESIEKGSYPEAMGLAGTEQFLNEVNAEAQKQLKELSIFNGPLYDLLEMNRQRKS
jgi:geranylgeranyl diphosphate synthase type II